MRVGTMGSQNTDFLPLRKVIQDFLLLCVQYRPAYQMVKYTIQEMMSLRRHNDGKLKLLASLGLNFGKLSAEFHRVGFSNIICFN